MHLSSNYIPNLITETIQSKISQSKQLSRDSSHRNYNQNTARQQKNNKTWRKISKFWIKIAISNWNRSFIRAILKSLKMCNSRLVRVWLGWPRNSGREIIHKSVQPWVIIPWTRLTSINLSTNTVLAVQMADKEDTGERVLVKNAILAFSIWKMSNSYLVMQTCLNNRKLKGTRADWPIK